ncbi:MAG TPA: hypothetical protein VFH56_02665 [Acidimicrobiales bacterium]|nr:hypothetical protein [Acidimicrobiales bacterium]
MATKSKLSRIEKRKRLEALFDRGAYVRFNADENGRPVIDPESESDTDMKIWVGPPSPLQREMAVREAQAQRARMMIEARNSEDSVSWLTIRSFIAGLNTDDLIEYVLDLDEGEFMSQARREVLQQKEWDDFNSLRDAMRQYDEAGAPVDDPEWEPLLARDREFGKQVNERADQIREDAKDGYKHMPRNKTEDKAIDKRIEQAGSAAFVNAYEEWMLFYSCRDDEDHSILYFENKDQIKALPQVVQDALATKLAGFITEASEAKN